MASTESFLDLHIPTDSGANKMKLNELSFDAAESVPTEAKNRS